MPTLVQEFDVSQFEKGVLQIRRGLDQVEAEGRKTGASLDKSFSNTKGIANTTKETGKLNTGMRTAGAGAGFLKANLVGLVAGFSFGQVIDELKGFDQSMQRARAVTQATEGQFASLKTAALELGRTSRFSSKEAADAIVFLGQAGLKTNEILDLLPVSLRLAAASSVPLSRAADVLTNTISAFGESSKAAGEAADIMSKALVSGNINFEQLAVSLRQVAPVANAAGSSLEEVSAAVAVLGDNSIQGEQAGTALRAIILSLVDPSKNARDAIQSLGLKLEDVNPEKVGIVGAFKALNEAQIGVAETSKIFGREAAAAASVLTKNVGSVDKLRTALENADGTTKRISDTLNDSLTASIAGSTSAFSGLIQAIGDAGATDALRGIFDAAADSLNELTDSINESNGVFAGFFNFIGGQASDAIKRLSGGFIDIDKAVKPIDDFFIKLGKSVLALVERFRDLVREAGGITAVFTRIGDAIEDTFTGAIDKAKDALDGLLSILPDSVKSFVGLGEKAEEAAEEIEALDDSASDATRSIEDLSDSAGDLSGIMGDSSGAAGNLEGSISGLGFAVNSLAGDLPALGNQFEVTFEGVNQTIREIDVESVSDLTRDVLDFIGIGFEDVFGKKVGPIVEDFVGLVDRNFDTISDIVGATLDFFGLGWGDATEQAGGAIFDFADIAINAFGGGTGGGGIFGAIDSVIRILGFGGGTGGAGTLFGSLGGLIPQFGATGAAGTGAMGSIGTSSLGLAGILSNPVTASIAGVVGALGLLELAGVDVFGTLGDVATFTWDLIESVGSAAFSALSSAASAMGSVITGIFNTLASVASSIFSTITSVATSAFSTITSAASSAFSAITSAASAMGSALTGIFNTLASVASSVFSSIASVASGAFSAISSAASAMGGVVTGALNSIASVGASVFGALAGAASSAFGSIISAASSAASQVGGILGGITSSVGGVGSAIGGIAKSVGGGIKSVGKKIGKAFGFAEGAVIDGPTSLLGDGLAGGRFRRGTVLPEPTILGNLANVTPTSELGLAGEAGKEGLLPLAEGPAGLSVNAVGLGRKEVKVFIIEGVDRAETERMKRRITALDASVPSRATNAALDILAEIG